MWERWRVRDVVNCSSPLCSVIFHIVINKIAYSLSIRLSSSSYVAFHLSLHHEASLKRLEVDCIDLYYQHRIDTRVPIEVTVCAPFRPFLQPFFWVFLRLILPGWFSPVFGDSSYFPKFRSWLVNFCIIRGKCFILLKLLVHCTVWFCLWLLFLCLSNSETFPFQFFDVCLVEKLSTPLENFD